MDRMSTSWPGPEAPGDPHPSARGPQLPGHRPHSPAQGPYQQAQDPYQPAQGPYQPVDSSGPTDTASAAARTQLQPLRVLSVLLVVASLGYALWHALHWAVPLVQTVSSCPATRGMQCLVSETVYAWVYLPLLFMVLCWSFASGAATEAKQGRRRGYLYVVAGAVALFLAWWVSIR